MSERIALLGNAGGLLDAGLLGGDDYLRIVASAVGDPDPAVAVVALDGLEKVEMAFVDDSLREPFAGFVRRTLGPALERIGRLPHAGEPEAVALLRPQLLGWLAVSGRDPDVRAFATAQADAYLADPKAVPADVAAVLLRLSALDGDEARFETYRRRFEAAKDPGERSHFLRPLGYFEKPELVERALEYSLRGPLRDREVATVAATLRTRSEGADRAFAWVREHWAEVAKRTPPELVPFYAGYAGGCSAERLAAAREFFGAPERRTPQFDVRLGRTADQVTQCVALRAREGAKVAALLRGEEGAVAPAASARTATASSVASSPPAATARSAAPSTSAATSAAVPVVTTSAAAPMAGASGATAALAPEVRLGDTVMPTSERLQLRLDPAAPGYSGTAEIALRVREAVRSFRFHAEAMEVGPVSLQPAGGGQAIAVTAMPAGEDLVEVTAAAPIPPGEYRLRVDFRNDYGSRAVGLHHVTTGGKHYLFTDFEPADAREAFPCFDEPGFKIPWRLELTVPAGLVAVANAPVESTRPAESGWETVTFAATPPLSTYLVAFAVGPFDVVEIPGTSVPARILTVAGQGALAGMARDTTAPLLAALER